MGFFKKLCLGAAGLKTYQNIYNRPIINPPRGYVVRGMKQKGIGSNWVITYSKVDSMNITSTFTVNSATKAVSIGAHKFTIDWP